MPRLREILSGHSYERIRTYMQSGNVILSSSASSEAVAADLHRLIDEHFAVDSAIIMRSPDVWSEVVCTDAFASHPDQQDDRFRYVVFLDVDPDPGGVRDLDEASWGDDAITVRGRHAFITYADGMHGSRLQPSMISERLGCVATARNWRTVRAVWDRLEDRGPRRSSLVHPTGTQR